MIGPYICRILTCAKLRKAMLQLLFSWSDSLSAPVPGQSFVAQCQVAVVAGGADLTILIILFTS